MSTKEERTCQWRECDITFIPKTHNMKYCSDDHLRKATNARIMEKYYERKERRGGKKRICKTPACQTILSRYNEEKYCAKCEAQKIADESRRLLDLIS